MHLPVGVGPLEAAGTLLWWAAFWTVIIYWDHPGRLIERNRPCRARS